MKPSNCHAARMRLGEDRTITLKNGDVVNAWRAAQEYDRVLRYVDEFPQHFLVLRELLHDPAGSYPAESIQFLRNVGFIGRDRSMRPLTRSMLESSFQDTAEGLVAISPFQFKDDGERNLIEAIYARNERLRVEQIKQIIRGDDEIGESPSRG